MPRYSNGTSKTADGEILSHETIHYTDEEYATQAAEIRRYFEENPQRLLADIKQLVDLLPTNSGYSILPIDNPNCDPEIDKLNDEMRAAFPGRQVVCSR